MTQRAVGIFYKVDRMADTSAARTLMSRSRQLADRRGRARGGSAGVPSRPRATCRVLSHVWHPEPARA
jgi:hypothetical protein